MKTLSLLEFAVELGKLPLAIAVEQHEAMERACVIVEKEAKAAIGHYQAESGPFAAWELLHYSTLHGGVSPSGHPFPGKIPLGYASLPSGTDSADNPELREGGLRDSIHHEARQGVFIGNTEGVVGSDSDVMVYQELGTSNMSPRSILGGAAARKSDEVAQELGAAAVMALIKPGGSGVRIR